MTRTPCQQRSPWPQVSQAPCSRCARGCFSTEFSGLRLHEETQEIGQWVSELLRPRRGRGSTTRETTRTSARGLGRGLETSVSVCHSTIENQLERAHAPTSVCYDSTSRKAESCSKALSPRHQPALLREEKRICVPAGFSRSGITLQPVPLSLGSIKHTQMVQPPVRSSPAVLQPTSRATLTPVQAPGSKRPNHASPSNSSILNSHHLPHAQQNATTVRNLQPG